jgi:hypothetical protein
VTRAKLPSDQFGSICTGVDGGLLFEHFAATGGNRVSRRAVLALAKVCRDEKRECTAQESADLVEDERVAFFFTSSRSSRTVAALRTASCSS